MTNQSKKSTILFTHLSGFGSYVFPFGSIIIPFLIRETKKDESKQIDTVTKDVVNFNLSFMLYTIILKISIIPFFIGTFFNGFTKITHNNNRNFHLDYNQEHFYSIASILSIMAIIKAILIVQAAVKSNNNETYKYPFVIKFIQ